MEKPDAITYFRGEPRHNCAQAVLMAYAPLAGVDQSCVNQFSHFGGGHAPGGECGALFAAKALVTDPTIKQEIERDFVNVTGTTHCRDIRKSRSATCDQCVQTATDAVYARVMQGCSLRPPQLT